jgi:hypothetical protein
MEVEVTLTLEQEKVFISHYSFCSRLCNGYFYAM